MSNVLRIHLKLFSNIYNKSSNFCLNKKCFKLNSIQLTLRSISCHSKTYQKTSKDNVLTKRQNTSETELTIGQKVKQTTEDISYLGVILIGVSVTALIGYAIFRELFSSVSPNVLYSKALKLCKSDPRVVEALGLPIKGFGEMTSRGRRRHVSSLEYEKDGQTVIRVQFYLKGSKTSATVHLEAYKRGSHSGFRYLFVDLDNNSRNVIVLEDNRSLQSISG